MIVSIHFITLKTRQKTWMPVPMDEEFFDRFLRQCKKSKQ